MRGEAEKLVWREKQIGQRSQVSLALLYWLVCAIFLGFAENYPVAVRCGHEQK